MAILKLPGVSRLNVRIGTKLAVAAVVGGLLVAGMIVNQQLSNASVARLAEVSRNEQAVAADLLHAGVALQRMQTGTREIRLAISEREADEALAQLQSSMADAVSYLQSSIQLCDDPENAARLEALVKLAKGYAAAAAEMTKLKKDYAEITKPLEQAQQIGTQVDALIEKATSVAKTVAAQRTVAAMRQIDRAAHVGIGFGFFVAVILGGAAIFGMLAIGRPIRRIAETLLRLAGGTRDLDIPYTSRGDEVGDAARAAQTFRDNLVRLETLEAEQKQATGRAVEERKKIVSDLADGFERAVGNIAAAVSSAATDLETAASTLSENAASTQQLSAAVAIASQQTSANVQSVASSASEVGASIEEIGRQLQQSTQIAAEAVKQAGQTDTRIMQLSDSASRIGDVITLITTIAAQTNLLALNATIEAARAGEAGKGFAVVASEVKMLATQTAKATETIKSQIAEMQHTTKESVVAIKEISGTISRISEIAASITAAVNAQGSATQEIADNVAQAAQSASDVASNITEVEHDARETGSASDKVLQAAQFLSCESHKLEVEVQNFIASVRVG
jgi:methyl-accepting chemotaxis protein